MADSEKRKKILIMDDEEMVGEIACHLLGFLGYGAVWVTGGRQALDMYTHHQQRGETFAAVIMDLTIPGGMGGRETVGEILALNPAARVFVASGYSTDPIMVNHRDYGFVGAIAKPFDLAAFESMLASL